MPVRIPPAFALLIAFAAFGPVPAHARPPRQPNNWTSDSPCGKYRFVMRYFNIHDEIAKQYPVSGLYRIDAPAVPLWSVRWYAYKGAVEIASAGNHLVIAHSDQKIPEKWDVHFFTDGRLIRSHSGPDLVDYTWEFGLTEERELDAQAGTFWMTTQDGNSFLFNLTTGEIVWQSRPWRVARGVLAAILLVLNASIGWWHFTRKGRGARRPDSTPRERPERPPSEAGHQGITRVRE